MQDSVIVTMIYLSNSCVVGLSNAVCGLSNGAISSDLEQTLTLFSRSHNALMPDISQMATDTPTVTV